MSKKRYEEKALPVVTKHGPAGVNEFFQSLGRGPCAASPSAVAMNPDDYAEVCLSLAETPDHEERVLALAMWLMCGPRPDKRVAAKRVRVYAEPEEAVERLA